MRHRLNALQQRFMRASYVAQSGNSSGLSTEPSEFEAKYARLLQARDTLKKVETTTKLFLKKAHALAKVAKQVGAAMGTPTADLKKLAEELGTSLEDDTLVKAISAKVQLLDDTVKQRRKLEDLRLVRDHHTQRLNQIKAKRAIGQGDDVKLRVEEAKWQAKLEHSQKEYDELLQELTEALDFIDAQTRADGPWALVGVELDAFRTTQTKMFHNVEMLFVGAPLGAYQRDPAAEKAAVEAQKAAEAEAQAPAEPATPSSTDKTVSSPVPSPTTPSKIEDATAAAKHSSTRPKPPKPPGAESDEEEEDEE